MTKSCCWSEVSPRRTATPSALPWECQALHQGLLPNFTNLLCNPTVLGLNCHWKQPNITTTTLKCECTTCPLGPLFLLWHPITLVVLQIVRWVKALGGLNWVQPWISNQQTKRVIPIVGCWCLIHGSPFDRRHVCLSPVSNGVPPYTTKLDLPVSEQHWQSSVMIAGSLAGSASAIATKCQLSHCNNTGILAHLEW